jgi:ribosomal protein RSM22 (predicted rRNA methylase)
VIADVSRGSGTATWPHADLVVASYALAELTPPQQAAVIDDALWATAQLLVIVEPGTPAGFARIHAARRRLLATGVPVTAPCSHAGVCPMHATGDWCHFAVRVPRSRRHRQVKGGTLGYEDEKFACLVVDVRGGTTGRGARVLRHPRIDKGQVGLEVCTPDRPTRISVTRRDAAYRVARKVDWGGTWPAAPEPED